MGAVARAFIDVEVDAGLSDAPEEEVARDQFCRTYTLLVLDNDRQPTALQMSSEDLLKPRGLLQSFFTGSPAMQEHASTVLRFIEERFAQGCYGQARLLLQLFDTDAGTRRNNERNLFYEEMILRFLSPREVEVPIPDATDDAPDTIALEQVAEALATVYGIRLQTFSQDGPRHEDWNKVWSGGDTNDITLEDVVPGPRWRSHWRARDVGETVMEHFEFRGARAFVENLTRCIYFITLAPGATGFEHLVSKYIDWMGAHYSMVPTRILPTIHRLINVGDLSISESFTSVWDDLEPLAHTADEPFSDEEIRAVLAKLTDDFADADFSDIPPGDYDLGGLVAMRLFGFEPGDLGAELRINRVT